MKRGFSILELMIAMALITMVLGGVIIVSFSNQANLVGGEVGAEATHMAQGLLEEAQALGRKDFNLVNATSTTDGYYTSTVSVELLPDYLTKKVTATVAWKDQRNQPRSLDITTLIANFTNTSGGTTCNSSPSGNWKSPSSVVHTLTGLAGVIGSYPVTGIDAYRNKLYVTAGPTIGNTDKTFFAFNISGGVPTYIGGSSLDTSGNTSTKGPSAVTIVATTTASSGKVYAYLANSVNPDWSNPASCATASVFCSQLQVVDVTNPASPALVKNFKFATSSKSTPNVLPYVSGSGGQAVGKSLFYRNGYLFIGLSKTASGPEFNIIDVHDPLNPVAISPGFSVGASINAIYVRGNFAYLATDDNSSGNILTILDISDPTTPTRVWAPVYASSFGYGRDVAVVGDTLYFGMSYNSTNPELFALRNASPSTAAPSALLDVDAGGTLGINNLLIRDYLAFLLTSSGSGNSLQIINATSTAQYASPVAIPASGSALDCEGNYIYAGSSDASGSITVVTGS